MYLDHFGLKEYPFTLTPNTHFYVDLPCHHEAFQVLKTALHMGEGFIKVTGEVGTGKTLICRKLLNELSAEFIAAYIPDPYLTPVELRRALATELDLAYAKDIDPQQLLQELQIHLVKLAQQGKSVVLIVDEAQALPYETLEALRLFTNLETEQRKLVQVVLFAQSELDQRLAKDELRQLRQRITFSYKLRPLNEQELAVYVDRRLLKAGFEQVKPLMSRKTLKTLSQASRGIPRLINVLTHKALLLSYGQGKKSITKEHIISAIADTEDATEIVGQSHTLMMAAAIIGAGFIGGLASWWLLGGPV